MSCFFQYHANEARKRKTNYVRLLIAPKVTSKLLFSSVYPAWPTISRRMRTVGWWRTWRVRPKPTNGAWMRIRWRWCCWTWATASQAWAAEEPRARMKTTARRARFSAALARTPSRTSTRTRPTFEKRAKHLRYLLLQFQFFNVTLSEWMLPLRTMQKLEKWETQSHNSSQVKSTYRLMSAKSF